MRDFEGRIAVVTGAASGIGRGLADRFVAEGMKVVLADVEVAALDAAVRELADAGHDVIGVPTDVSIHADVDALADAAYDRYGAVHVLCNNAGVGGGRGPVWETTANDWTWVVGVNLMGVVHGVQAFVPRMIAGGDEGHVVNTSSVLGLSTGPGQSIYSVTKHAVTRLSEGLLFDLQAAGSRIGVSVLCPGLIATRIVTSARNRPAHLMNDEQPDEEMLRMRDEMQQRFLENGMPPAEVAGVVIDAIRDDTFYVLTHPEMELDAVRKRLDGILEGHPMAAQLI